MDSNRPAPAPPVRLSLVILALWLPGTAMGQTPADKDQYHLFNPTPRELMRELAADRPDATESPITVDAGHVQIEMSFFDYVHDDEGGEELDAWAFLDTNIKIGLTNSIDLQVVFPAYGEEQTELDATLDSPRMTERLTGFGDVQLRLKMNLWGNDPVEGQTTAFGIMPFVKIPTGTQLSNGRAEGGFIAMLGWDVAENWGLGFQAEIDAVYDEEDDDYDIEFLHTAVVGFDIAGPLGGYVEYVGILPSETATKYQAILSSGLTLQVTEDLVFDAGVQVGLNDDADDLNVFTGMTIRF